MKGEENLPWMKVYLFITAKSYALYLKNKMSLITKTNNKFRKN